jgi:hypothetical protein
VLDPVANNCTSVKGGKARRRGERRRGGEKEGARETHPKDQYRTLG